MTSSRKVMLYGPIRQALLLAIFCVVALFNLQHAWSTNAASLEARDHLSRRTECKANLGLMWEPAGEPIPHEQTPYLQALSASAGAPGAVFPDVQAWSRDLRLLYWFRAHALIREGKYAESLSYLEEAKAGRMLAATGHFLLGRHQDACAMFTWLLANEVQPGVTQPDVMDVTPWAMSLLDKEHAQIVVDAYSYALAYQPANADWKLMLAKAQLALKDTPRTAP